MAPVSRLVAVMASAVVMLLALIPPQVLAAVRMGTIPAAKSLDFIFLDKFCFDYTPPTAMSEPGGAVELLVTAADPSRPIEGLDGLQFWMFDDEDSSWPAMKYGRMTCAQREEFSRGMFPIRLSPAVNASAEDGVAAGQLVYRHTFDISQHIRPRFWWFGLVNCDQRFGNLRWKLHMYNFNTREILKEFGVNERHISFMYPLFLSAFVIISAAHVYGIWAQRDVLSAAERGNFKVHQIVQLFTVSLLLMTASLFLKQVHTSLFAINGYGISLLDRVGDVLDVISRVQLTMLIMLLASGWTISVAAAKNKRIILCALGTFGLLYVALLGARFLTLETNYVSIPTGLAVVLSLITVAWVVLALWFAVTVFNSFRREYKPQQRSMYLRLGFVYTFWLMCEPTVVLLTQLLSPWVRDKVIVSVQAPLSIVAYGWMAYLLWPSRASTYFMLDLPDVHDEYLNSQHNDYL